MNFKEEHETGLMTVVMCAVIVAVLFMSGCATKEPPAPVVVSSPAADCAKAIGIIATSSAGDATSKVVAVSAIERLCGNQQAQLSLAQASQTPASIGQTLFQAALQTADIVLRGYGIRSQRDVSIVQSNNAAATSIASYSAFQGIASSGFASNAAIAGNIQAPAPNITLSGAGVIGSGSYSVPTTTTTTITNPTPRVCSTSSTGVLTCFGG